MRSAYRKLSLVLPFGAQETATSFAARLAKRNGVGVTRSFCSDMGLDWRKLIIGDTQTVEALAVLGDVDPAMLAQNTPRLTDEKCYRVGYETLGSSYMARTKLRFCSRCLQGDQQKTGGIGIYQRVTWQIDAIKTCELHGCFLTEIPSESKYGSVWDFGKQVQSLEKTEYPLAHVITSDISNKLETYLLQRIRAPRGSRWIDTLSHHVVAQTSTWLGLLVVHGANPDLSSITALDWIAVAEVGFAILMQGPAAFSNCLKKIQNQSSIAETNHRVTFDVFYNWLRNRRDDPAFDPIRHAFSKFLFANYPWPVGTTIFGIECGEQKLFTINSASTAYSVSSREMATKALEAGLAYIDETTNRIVLRKFITANQAKLFADEISILMDSQDAAKYLGLNKHVFEQLVRRKHILGVRKTQKSHWKFTAAILDEFVKRLVGKANAAHDAHGNIEEISLVAKRLSCKSEHIVELILKDELRTVVRLNSKMAIQSIGVSVNEVKTVMTVPPVLGCTRVEATLRLKISRNATKQLLKTGYLSEKIIRFPHGGRPVRIVTSKSMAQFEEKYVSLGQLARSLDRVPGPLATHLTSRGIHPLESVREISNIYLKMQIPDL